MVDCLFCKIIAQEIPADIVYEDTDLLGFRDVNPQAPVHILVIPKKHIATLNDLQAEDERILAKIMLTAKSLAEKEAVAETGYRVLFNCNRDGGQTVDHIHLHLLGGRQMRWPPG